MNVQHQLMAVHLERRALSVHHDAGQVEVLTIQAQRLNWQLGVAANSSEHQLAVLVVTVVAPVGTVLVVGGGVSAMSRSMFET